MSIASLIDETSPGGSMKKQYSPEHAASSSNVGAVSSNIANDFHELRSPNRDSSSEGENWMPVSATLKQRATRPVYNEEQKFFIMYTRIVLDQGWSDIEDRFAEVFGQRSKDGLTSMYYRIRKSW